MPSKNLGSKEKVLLTIATLAIAATGCNPEKPAGAEKTAATPPDRRNPRSLVTPDVPQARRGVADKANEASQEVSRRVAEAEQGVKAAATKVTESAGNLKKAVISLADRLEATGTYFHRPGEEPPKWEGTEKHPDIGEWLKHEYAPLNSVGGQIKQFLGGKTHPALDERAWAAEKDFDPVKGTGIFAYFNNVFIGADWIKAGKLQEIVDAAKQLGVNIRFGYAFQGPNGPAWVSDKEKGSGAVGIYIEAKDYLGKKGGELAWKINQIEVRLDEMLKTTNRRTQNAITDATALSSGKTLVGENDYKVKPSGRTIADTLKAEVLSPLTNDFLWLVQNKDYYSGYNSPDQYDSVRQGYLDRFPQAVSDYLRILAAGESKILPRTINQDDRLQWQSGYGFGVNQLLWTAKELEKAGDRQAAQIIRQQLKIIEQEAVRKNIKVDILP